MALLNRDCESSHIEKEPITDHTGNTDLAAVSGKREIRVDKNWSDAQRTIFKIGELGIPEASTAVKNNLASIYEYYKKKESSATEKEEIDIKFSKLFSREDDWDGYGSIKPKEEVIILAQKWLFDFKGFVDNAHEYNWKMPVISSDEDGAVTIEWWHKSHELHIVISEEESYYTKVWGTNIDEEMVDGTLNEDKALHLWQWLVE